MSGTKRHVTIYDVAALAGVSIGTVSRTLNSPAKVADATRQRVLEAVRGLDFVPKEVAEIRARRGNGRIGVVAPFSAHSSFGKRLNGVMAATAKVGVDVVVFDVESAESSPSMLESLPVRRSLDGLIVMSVPFSTQAFAAVTNASLPIVLVDTAHLGLPTVVVDDVMGGRLAGAELISRGAKRLAFLGHRQVSPGLELPARLRLRGLRLAAEEAGVPFRDDFAVLVSTSFEESLAAATRLLEGDERPDAVFAHTDEQAAAVLKAAGDLGLSVPEDVAIVGYDNSIVASALGLTSVDQPLHETGEWAANTLLNAISDPSQVLPSVTLPVSLVRRAST